MAVVRKRDKLVSFRLSAQEYESLQTLIANAGARSISDFARTTLCDAVEGAHIERPASEATTGTTAQVQRTLERLATTMGELNRVIGRLSFFVESTYANKAR
jgi:Mobilization protein NikA